MKEISKIGFVGSGNVATNIATRLCENGVSISQLWSRNTDNAKSLADRVSAQMVDELTGFNSDLDLIIIAVVDDAITSVAAEIDKNIPVVHTSGGIGIEVLAEFEHYGSFYPLQTLTSERYSPFTEIPILVEASSDQFEERLIELAGKFTSHKALISSEKRTELHVAAVIVNNFTNHLYHEAEKYCKTHGLNFNLLKPLITETAAKIQDNPAITMQTGPAKRNDQTVIRKHMELLQGDPELRSLYETISNLIIKTHSK